ncbi:MAG: NUDIX domain-containing protein [Eubacteriales bacterium]|nr:NUDIX domain-containing protein [Eubacteriales bacterium]
MSHCTVCGGELEDKMLENEGMIPFCNHCGEYRFPMFNTAISAIVYNPDGDKIILIQQYGKKRNILVAGYVTKGEGVEETLVREIKEELGLDVIDYTFNASEYFPPSNTLMVNFACKVSSDSLEHTNEEVDFVDWYPAEHVLDHMDPSILAARFVKKWTEKQTYYR